MSEKNRYTRIKDGVIYKNIGINATVKSNLRQFAKKRRMTISGAAEVAIEKYLKEENFLP